MSFKQFTEFRDGRSGSDGTWNLVPDSWCHIGESPAPKPRMPKPDQLLAVSVDVAVRPERVWVCTQSQKFTETGWLIKVEGFIGEYSNFKVDTRKDREPMKLLTKWGAASEPGGLCDHSSQGVLNTLEFCQISHSDRIEERIAVVQSAAD